ncbi:hypothetical protein HS088_TW14G01169 [Tripterygium wilfordii]|uniref:Uncharacterized protein n=1 Tax=Tripterygium wilfordii TaxID=458696 RepID=A0A7J7CSE4_TRIWF|nr:hypothetical protein HS088_TW14G01169 [Tripterygium wilfordii]
MAAYFARNNGRDGRDRLAKIAEEGFALIDEGFYGGNRLHAAHFHQERQYGQRQYPNQIHYSCNCVYQYHRSQAVRVKQQPTVIASEYQADRPRQYFHRQDQHHQSHYLSHEPQVFTVKQQPVITSDEAAKLFGGIAIVEHRANYGFK